MFFHMAEYCDTPQSKERRNREYKACLNERAILRLLDHDVTRKSGCFSAPERDGFSKNSEIPLCASRTQPGFGQIPINAYALSVWIGEFAYQLGLLISVSSLFIRARL